jgi:thiol-disulfide isomerase/thioredoxin
MRFTGVLWLLWASAFPALSLASWWWPEGPHYFDSPDVKEFPNPGDFDRAMRSSDPLLVQFFAPWCGHCTGFRPTYKELGKQMHSKVRVAGIDCTVESNKDWCINAQKVPGYPTIRFYRHGGESLANYIEYQGSRSLALMKEWLENRLKPAISPAKTATQVLPEAVRHTLIAGSTHLRLLLSSVDVDSRNVFATVHMYMRARMCVCVCVCVCMCVCVCGSGLTFGCLVPRQERNP